MIAIVFPSMAMYSYSFPIPCYVFISTRVLFTSIRFYYFLLCSVVLICTYVHFYSALLFSTHVLFTSIRLSSLLLFNYYFIYIYVRFLLACLHFYPYPIHSHALLFICIQVCSFSFAACGGPHTKTYPIAARIPSRCIAIACISCMHLALYA